jgi:hypothetical protein
VSKPVYTSISLTLKVFQSLLVAFATADDGIISLPNSKLSSTLVFPMPFLHKQDPLNDRTWDYLEQFELPYRNPDEPFHS